MILDEPTAALDPLAEDIMYQTYNKLTAGRTSIFFISHRLSARGSATVFFVYGKRLYSGGGLTTS